MSLTSSLLRQHSQWPAARHIVETLQSKGYRALLAGGCVRDALLGVIAQDLDVATSARPDEVIALFPKTVEVGKAFGVVRVLHEGQDIEVATFREDGPSSDGRRPDEVHFSDERRDALRRDFTVNALFFDLASEEVLDYVGGREDLRQRLLRTVGEPALRFGEDHLRLLRAVRFGAQLDFQIETKTWEAVRAGAAMVAQVSRERVRDEMAKLLKVGAGASAQKSLEASGLLRVLFPELAAKAEELQKNADVLLSQPVEDRGLAFTYWLVPVARDASVLDATLAGLRLSKAEEKSLRERLKIYVYPETLWRASDGAQILAYEEKETREALDLREKMFGRDPRRRALHLAWKKRRKDDALPARLLTGRQMPANVQGPAMGEALQAAYEAQLEGKFADSEGALTWLAEWLRLKGR